MIYRQKLLYCRICEINCQYKSICIFCRFIIWPIITIYRYIICIFSIHNKIHFRIKNIQIYICISTVELFLTFNGFNIYIISQAQILALGPCPEPTDPTFNTTWSYSFLRADFQTKRSIWLPIPDLTRRTLCQPLFLSQSSFSVSGRCSEYR